MRKVLVLMLVLAAVSVANAAVTQTLEWADGIVTWSVSGGKFIGTGTSLSGIYDITLDDNPSIMTPTTGTDSGPPALDGLYAAAGNMSKFQDWGAVFNLYAQDVDLPPDLPSTRSLGVWFSFDIVTPGEISFYVSQGVVRETVFVPEPATMGLLSLGGLVLLRRRK